MSDKENEEDVTDDVQQFVEYPMLNSQDFLYTAKPPSESEGTQQTAVHTTPVLQTMPTPSVVEQPITEMKPSWLRRVRPSSSWFLKKKQSPREEEDDGTMWAGTTIDEATKPLVPSTVPGYQTPKLLELIQQRAPSSELIRAGATVESLRTDEVYLDDFYRNGYSLRDVHAIIGDFDTLMDYGFTRQHVTGSWCLDQICTLYDKQKFEVCQRLGFRADDFVRTHITPQEMASLGITTEILKDTLKISFATIFSMNIRFDEFATAFKLTKESMQALNLNPTQKIALSAHRGWTPSAVRRKLSLSIEELADIWFMLDLE